jgi:predicted aspartyl protease
MWMALKNWARILPAACALSVPAAAAVRPITDVPMRYVRGAVLVDHVRINGQGDYTFLLDTGSTACTITSQVADQLGLARTGWSNVAAIGSSKKLRVVTVGSISIGTARVDSPLTLIADDNGLSKHVGSPVQGVLGTPVLWQWPVQFDYPAQRFRILPKSYDLRTEPVETPWSNVGNLIMTDRAAFVQVALNGAAPHRMMLDTGATGIVVDEATAESAKARAAQWSSTSLSAFGPRRDSTYWLLDSIRVAGLTIQNAQAFTPHAMGDWRSNQLGNDALDQFRLTVDASRKVFRLERDQMPEDFEGYPWGVGLTARRDMDAIRVGRVWPGSEAAANGIAAGDEIVAVNDNVAAEITDASLRDLLTQPPGYPVTVEVRSSEGAPRTVQLRSQRYTRKRPATSSDALAATSLSVVQPAAAAAR